MIPTYSRPHAVQRHFVYWKDTPIKVLILDGSKEALNLRDSERKFSNVSYVHTGTRFNDRLATAGDVITTPYAALLADDEFFLKGGLRQCVRHLDDHPSTIGCTGKVLGFFVEQNRFLTFPMYDEWLPFPTDRDDLRGRLDFALPPKKAHKVTYSLFRTNIWTELFRESYRTFYSSGYVYERLLNFYSAILGRTELLDCVVWMRSLENRPLSTEDVPRTMGRDFLSWARNPEFSGEVKRLRNVAQTLLERPGMLSDKEIKDFVTRFVDGGIKRQADKQERNRKSVKRRLGKFLLNNGPKNAKKLAKRWMPARTLRFTGWEGRQVRWVLRQLERSGTEVCVESLSEVANLALGKDLLLDLPFDSSQKPSK